MYVHYVIKTSVNAYVFHKLSKKLKIIFIMNCAVILNSYFIFI